MQINLGTYLETVLEARDRDLSVIYEIYAADYDSSSGFDPTDAEQTFAGISYTLPYGPTVYRREVLQGPTIQKTVKKQINSVSIGFSNVSRFMADYVLSNTIEGKKLVVRIISRSAATTIGNSITVLNNSLILFVGRLDKPDGFNRSRGTLSAKQDLGTIEAQIPARQFQPSCPLEFKGPECLGTELLAAKSATYQAAATCNFSFAQCSDYGNTEFFQGTRVIQIESSFVHKSHQGFFTKLTKIVFPLIGLALKRRSTTVNNSIHDGSPYGSAIPVILGRWYKSLIPLQFQDIGTSINFLMAACRGKISDFINVRNESLGFTQPIGVTEHLGEYGGDGSQTADTVFPEHGFFSRLAYVTGYCNGSDIETEDPAPEITAVIAGIVPDRIYYDVDHDGTGKLAAGTGGTTAPGSSVTPPASPAASFDAAMTEPGDPIFYFKLQETVDGNTYPTSPGGMIDSSGNGNNGWHLGITTGGPTLGISTPEVPVQTDPASRFASGPVGGVLAPSGSSLDPRGDQTWIAIGRVVSHAAQQWLFHRGGSFGLSFGLGLGTNEIFASWGNGGIGSGIAGQLSSGSIVVEDGRPYLIVSTRQGNIIRLYVNGCLVDEETDFPEGDIVFSPFNDNPWLFGFEENLVFGPIWQTDGLSSAALFPFAWTDEQQSRLWASMRVTPTGCPGEDWTDNPVDHTRWIITEPSLLNNPDGAVDDYLSAYAAAYNCGAIKDESNAERALGLLPNSENGKAGIDYKRYNSTGLLGPQSFDSSRTQIPAGVPAREAIYEYFDVTAPPISLDVVTVYRKRFTCNVELTEAAKVLDVLYDKIFPCFRGFLRFNTKGQIVIDSERPADWTSLRSASIVGATTLTVQDVLPWKTTLGSPYLLEGKLHIDRKISYVYDNAAIRTSATGFVAGDVGKYALQKDFNTIWRLTATTPTWTQETTAISEVRRVTAAVYSNLGDSITLASSASGGTVATASGATLTGGSTTVKSSGTVTITGSLTQGSSITVTINGIACVLNLVSGESSSTIGHRMAAVINAEPLLREYIEAHATANVVTIYSKIGVLTLSSALENAHTVNTELTRVMMSFAGKALTYADTTRANILDGTFEWPDAARQSLVNQVKATPREAVMDFARRPIVINDFDHQRRTLKTNPAEIDMSPVDNYNTAARLCNGYLNKYRDGDRFYSWGSTGVALLLDEGDVVCVSDDSGSYRNVLVRLEDLEVNTRLEISVKGRLYSRDQYSDLVASPVDVAVERGLPNFEQPPPDISFNTVDFPPNGLIQSTDGSAGITSIRGGAIFGDTIYKAGMYGIVKLIKRAGVVVDEVVNADLRPNSDLKATFEFIASADGLYTVQLQACNQWGCSATVMADIYVGFGSTFGILRESGFAMLRESGGFIEREH